MAENVVGLVEDASGAIVRALEAAADAADGADGDGRPTVAADLRAIVDELDDLACRIEQQRAALRGG